MKLTSVLYLLPLFFLFPFTISSQSAAYTTADYILLNCGESSDTTTPEDGRKWSTDEKSKFLASNSEVSFTASASYQDHSVTQVPYMTARASYDKFTYSFPVTPGLKFLRFYFYAVNYSRFDGTTSLVSVTANSYLLMKNFSAFLTASAKTPAQVFLIKEFMVPVLDKERLTVTFSPSPNSVAFVNGIEVVSMPNNLYGGNKENSLPSVGSNIPFDLLSTTAFETASRLNVGGQDGAVYSCQGIDIVPFAVALYEVQGQVIGHMRPVNCFRRY